MQPMLSVTVGLAAALLAAAAVGGLRLTRLTFAGAGPLAVGAGFLVGYGALLGWPPLPPREASHRLFYAAAVATLLGLLDARVRLPIGLRRGLHAVLFAGVATFLLLPSLRGTWPVAESLAWVIALGGIGFALWSALGGWDDIYLPALAPLTLGGMALLFALTGSAALGLLAAAACLASTATAVTARPPERGTATVLAAVLAGLGTIGAAYTETPRISLLLLVAGPIAARLLHTTAVRWPGWPAKAARGIVPLGLTLAALAPVLTSTDPVDHGPAEGDYSVIPAAAPNSSPAVPIVPAAPEAEDDNPFRRFTAPTDAGK